MATDPSTIRPRRRMIAAAPDAKPTLSMAEAANRKRAEDKERFLTALRSKLGVILYAVQATGISRSVVYKWLNNDAEFRAAVDEIGNDQIDYVERKLLELIKGHGSPGEPGYIPPNNRAVIFYLATKAKHRGYTNRVELSTPQPLSVEAKVSVAGREEMDVPALAAALAAVAKTCPDVMGGALRQSEANGGSDVVGKANG